MHIAIHAKNLKELADKKRPILLLFTAAFLLSLKDNKIDRFYLKINLLYRKNASWVIKRVIIFRGITSFGDEITKHLSPVYSPELEGLT